VETKCARRSSHGLGSSLLGPQQDRPPADRRLHRSRYPPAAHRLGVTFIARAESLPNAPEIGPILPSKPGTRFFPAGAVSHHIPSRRTPSDCAHPAVLARRAQTTADALISFCARSASYLQGLDVFTEASEKERLRQRLLTNCPSNQQQPGSAKGRMCCFFPPSLREGSVRNYRGTMSVSRSYLLLKDSPRK